MPGIGDESPRFRKEAAEQANALLLKVGANRVLDSPEGRLQWVAGMDGARWINSLANFSAALQGIPLDQVEFSFNARVGPYAAPARRHHKPLLAKALVTMQKIAADPSLPPDVALRRMGLTAAGAINMIHPFANGNGRLGRWLGNILEQGFDGSKEAQARLVDVATDRLSWATDPSCLTAGLTRMVEDEVLGTEARPGIPRRTDIRDHRYWTADKLAGIPGLNEAELRRTARALNDETGFLALYKTLRDTGKMSRALLSTVHDDSGRVVTSTLRGAAAVSALDAGDCRALMATSENLRAWRVDLFLDEMADARPQSRFRSRGQERGVADTYASELVAGSSLLAGELSAGRSMAASLDTSPGLVRQISVVAER